MPIKPDLIFKNVFSLKGSVQKSAVGIHSAQFSGQVVLWPTPYQGDLDWCRGWSSNGANGWWQSVFLQLNLLRIPIQGQQLDLLLQLPLPRNRDGAGPQPLNTKWKVPCAGGLPPRQGWPGLQPLPQELFLGGAHALEFAGQPEGRLFYVVCIVGRQEPFPAASAAAITRRRGGGGGRNRQRVRRRQWGLLLLFFYAVGRRIDLKSVVKLRVVDSEEALLQGHDGEEAMAPQDLIFSVRRPRLACHTCDGEKRYKCWKIEVKDKKEISWTLKGNSIEWAVKWKWADSQTGNSNEKWRIALGKRGTGKKKERNERNWEELVLLIIKAHEIKHSVKYFIL